MTNDEFPDRKDDFDERLQRAKDKQEAQRPENRQRDLSKSSAIGAAIRIGTELVAALIVGLGIGYVLDLWLGTKPWLMILFFFLGSAAGVLNVYRAASGIGLSPGYRRPPGDGDDRGEDEGR